MKIRRTISLTIVMALLFGLMLPGTGYAYTEKAATVNASSLNVRSQAGTGYSAVAKLSHGAGVTVINETTGTDGQRWYQIRFNQNGEKTGFVLGSFLKFPVNYTTDGNFESYLSAQGFPESYKVGLRQLHAQYPNWVFTAQQTNLDWNTVIQNESIVGRNLVSSGSISSWKSIADGAYNWDSGSWPGFDSSSWVAASEDIIRYYMDPRNFLDETYVFQFLNHSYDGSSQTKEGLQSLVSGSFLAGSTSAVSGGSSGTANPDDNSQGGNSQENGNPGGNTGSGSTGSGSGNTSSGYGPGYKNSGNTGNGTAGGSSEGSKVIGTSPPPQGTGPDVKLQGPSASRSKTGLPVVATGYGPGMSGGGAPAESGSGAVTAGSDTSYVDIIMNAGAQAGVNPYVLAAMMIQEQGTNGTGGSISGKVAGYEGYYNFFNIEAYQSGSMSPVQRGLWYASQSGNYGRPWNSVDRAIAGGATFYGNTYVKAGQDTFYLKKYNVQGSNPYKHQYMTNVQGAAGEGAKLSKAYSAALKQTGLEFKIPVFTNMPESPSGKPTGEGSPNNKLSGLSVSGFSITPTFHKDTQNYDLIVDPSVTAISISASPIDGTATVSGIGQISLSQGNNELKISVKAQNGAVREYVLRVVRQQNGQTGGGAASPQTGSGAAGPGVFGPGMAGGTGSGGSETSGENPGGTGAIVVP